jgi:hypothetical protein
MKPKVIFEQQEFQHFVYQYIRNSFDKYNTIPPEAKEMFKVFE